MAAEDWIPDYYGEEDDDDERITCKYCGKSDLYWDQTSRGWRLFEISSDKIHLCLSQHKEKNNI